MYAENLKKIRKELDLSVAKFSAKIGIPAPTLTCYERKERVPSINLCIQLHKKLNVNLNWFISGEGEMFNSSNTTAAPINVEQLKQDLLLEVRHLLQNEGVIK